MPLGFALIALRLLLGTSDRWPVKWAAFLVAAAGLWMGYLLTPVAAHWAPWAIGLLLLAALGGAPIFVILGGSAILLFWGRSLPITAVAIEHYGLVTNPALPSIPLFTLAGFLMAEGGSSTRLVRLFSALFGGFSGGPAAATALICAFFTAFTGGSGVTILALGGLLLPVLIAARYSERDALGLITGAGSLGILFPPSLPVILYAIIAKVDIREMFLGGVLPGALLIILTALWGIRAGRAKAAGATFQWKEVRAAAWSAKWELLLPVVSLGALLSGRATAVEAAALTAGYAALLEMVIHRDLHWRRDIPRVLREAGVLMGGILLILGVALGLTSYWVDAQIPDRLADWAAQNIQSKWLFLLGLNLVLILVGGVMEIFAAIVVVVPLLVPIGQRLEMDPIHLGVLFLANMELGFLAPPIGLNLLLASYRLKKPVGEVTRAVLPLLAVLFLGVLLITYVPALTTALPRWLR